MNPALRLSLGVAAATLVLAGCGKSGGGDSGTKDADRTSFNRAARNLFGDEWKTDFSRRSAPLSEFRSGGPPRDGIPPIDRPRFVDVPAADRFLDDREPVMVVESGRKARAYPQQILVWHEIVNDEFDGRPLAVTYCPLCNSALVFDRRVGKRTLTFGTTGKLRRSDLVMWDRQTESWWQQFNGTALVGTLDGTKLRPVASQVLSWEDFRERHPDGSVLSRDTGAERDYGRNPYPGYENPDQRPFLYEGEIDPSLPPKERVVLVTAGERAVVVPFSRLRRRSVVSGTIGTRPFVVLFKRGVASVLDAEAVADSRDVGTAGVFDARVDGRRLTFYGAAGGRFRDVETGSLGHHRACRVRTAEGEQAATAAA